MVRTSLSCALLIAVGALLESCSGGGGGDPRYWFGMNGSGPCDHVVVDVDLASASATVARAEDGSLDCHASEVVSGHGCSAAFRETGGGSTLQVTIDGCSLGAVSSLFECAFASGDPSRLSDAVATTCSCSLDSCDGTPPACVSTNPDPGSCEDCGNGKDDDGNGLIDCADPNCAHSLLCPNATTTTSSTLTSTTTTTTTMPAVAGFVVGFGLHDATNVGSISWDTYYGGATSAAAAKRDAGSGPTCQGLVPSATSTFVDDPAAQTIHATVSGLSGDSGPVDLAQCTFDSSTVPSPDDFAIHVTDARDTSNNEITPPSVTVNSVTPVPITTTTVTSTTEEPTGDVYRVSFVVESASASVGAVQIAVNYHDAPGIFPGSGATVQCRDDLTDVGHHLFAANDDDTDSPHVLYLAIATLVPFSAPAKMAHCTFVAQPGKAPVASDFAVTIDDATDADGNEIATTVAVRAQPASEVTTTTDGPAVTTTTEEPSVTTTTMEPTGDGYDVQFVLQTASAPLGSLQFDVNYASAHGAFAGSGGSVQCAADLAGVLFAANDADAAHLLTLGAISITSFSAPANLAHCSFIAEPGHVPAPQDFAVTVTVASDTDLNDATATIGVQVQPTL